MVIFVALFAVFTTSSLNPVKAASVLKVRGPQATIYACQSGKCTLLRNTDASLPLPSHDQVSLSTCLLTCGGSGGSLWPRPNGNVILPVSVVLPVKVAIAKQTAFSHAGTPGSSSGASGTFDDPKGTDEPPKKERPPRIGQRLQQMVKDAELLFLKDLESLRPTAGGKDGTHGGGKGIKAGDSAHGSSGGSASAGPSLHQEKRMNKVHVKLLISNPSVVTPSTEVDETYSLTIATTAFPFLCI